MAGSQSCADCTRCLQVILSGEATAEDVSTTKIADSTEGFSGSDLRQLCTAAAMCGIRELMKATSKATQDKAAAKKAKHSATSTIPDDKHPSAKSCTAAGAQDSPQPVIAGTSQQHGQQNGVAAGGSAADRPSTSQADEGALSSAAAASAVDGSAQNKSSNGNKRDNEEGGRSTTTKRLKSTVREDASHEQAGTANSTRSAVNAAQTDSNGSAEASSQPGSSEAASSQAQSQTAQSSDNGVSQPEDKQKETAGSSSSQLVEQQSRSGPPETSGQNRSQTLDWLLAKYSDVAAAADQQVRSSSMPAICWLGS